MPLSWPPKDPDEVLDYDVDWTVRLYSKEELEEYDDGENPDVVPADTIATSTFVLPVGAALIANSAANSPTATKIWLSGGDEGETYQIINRIQTAGGRTMDQTIALKVKTK